MDELGVERVHPDGADNGVHVDVADKEIKQMA
jgi:hypothetical protein